MAKDESKSKYGAEQIQVLEGLEPCPKAPWNVHRIYRS
jgi:DNA gyrase/topoisomerase IV subunit B